MPIIVSSNGSGNFVAHPEGGYPARCVDLYDELKSMSFGGEPEVMKHVVYITMFAGQYTEKNGDQVPLTVSRMFTMSLHEKATLRGFLEAWRGKKFSEQELKAFDLETLLGAPGYIQVTHAEKNGQTYANITACVKLPKGLEAPSSPEGFVRRFDREAQRQQQPSGIDRLAHEQRRDQRTPQQPARVPDEPDPVDTRGDDDFDSSLPF